MAKKKAGRPKLPKRDLKPERPVLSVRLPQIIFEDISAEAKAQNVSLTDVVYRRLLAYQRELRQPIEVIEITQYVEPHDARGAAWQQIERRAIETNLGRLGYTRIEGPGGAVWAEPGASIPAGIVKALTEPKE